MRRASCLVTLVVVLEVLCAASASAATTNVTHSGSVTGELKQGNSVTVRVEVHHPSGWHDVQRVVIALRLRGRLLDELLFESRDLSISIQGDGGPVVLGQPGALRGPFFAVDTSKVALNASGDKLGLVVPIKLASAPPAGARLFYTYDALGAPTPGFQALTPPVKANSGFSWGTLAVAIVVALFAGTFVGNLFSSRRRPQRPSIYGTVQRRLEEERARP